MLPPGGTTTFIALAVVLFGTNYKSFLVLYLGVIASSVLMDLIGRFGGAKIVKKMFGEEDFNKGEKILKEKGVIYLPCMYLFPLFPDDLLCCIAGISKINFWYHLLIICLCRGIGVATIVFGLELIPYKSLCLLCRDAVSCRKAQKNYLLLLFYSFFSVFISSFYQLNF